MTELGLTLDVYTTMSDTSCIKVRIKMKTNKIIAHCNRMSEQSYGRNLTNKNGFSDTMLDTNKKSVAGKTTDQVTHKYVK